MDRLLPKRGQAEEKPMGEIVLQLTKENIIPGITVALVAVPLSIGHAIAAGATANMGLITAIYGPMLNGILGGSKYNILGPASTLVIVLHTYTSEYGKYIVPWLALGGGVFSSLVYAL